MVLAVFDIYLFNIISNYLTFAFKYKTNLQVCSDRLVKTNYLRMRAMKLIPNLFRSSLEYFVVGTIFTNQEFVVYIFLFLWANIT